MGALASLLLKKGYQVTGSDLRENSMVAHLRGQGAAVAIGHDRRHIEGADGVIYSSAVREDNVELAEAARKGIPVFPRARLLAELMNGQIGITIAGAHGKTTTTSMAARLLAEAGFQPTTAVGGIINGSSDNARLGKGEYFVAEVDESDGSFLYFFPKYSIVTNIDFEHVDYFHNWENILEAYGRFIQQTDIEGCVIACGDDERLGRLLKECRRPFKTYGLGSRNDFQARNIASAGLNQSFDCYVDGRPALKVSLGIPGRHNVVNALACAALGFTIGIDKGIIQNALAGYKGVQRRFQTKGHIEGVWVVDDYGHHPTEIQATLETARQVKKGRLIVLFQPHRYSRVKHLWKEMAASLTGVDYLIVTDIYAASEPPLEGITAERLTEDIRRLTAQPVVYLKKERMVAHLLDIVRPGDLVLTLGAGDITYASDEIVRALSKSGNPKGASAPLEA